MMISKSEGSNSVHLLIVIFLIGFSLSSSSQLVLEEGTVGYLPNTPASMHKKTNGSLTQESGEDVVWDFSDISYNTSTTLEFDAVDNVSGSNLVDDNEYFSVSEYGITRTGTNLTSSQSGIPISWPIMNYTAEIGSVLGSSFDFNALTLCSYEGSTVTTVEGHGTLILPTGTFTNVTRFEAITSYTAECLNGSTSWHDITITNNYYFMPGCHIELLRTYRHADYEWYEPQSWEECSNPCLESSTIVKHYYFIKESTIPELCFIEGCADEEACNYEPNSFFTDDCFYNDIVCDDGDELTEGDMYVDCECVGVFAGDADEDGIMEVDDLLEFLSAIGCASDCEMDFNNDSIVNMLDLLIFLSYF